MQTAFIDVRDTVSLVKDVTTILAVLGALVYFGYKVYAGWLLLNLDISLDSERAVVKGGDDHLVVKIGLAKGKVDSARLLAAKIRVQAIATNGEPAQFRDVGSTRRLQFSDEEVRWDSEDPTNPLLTLAAEETMELSEHFRVTPGVAYRVDLVVRGDRFKDSKIPSLSQWRAAMTVLPALPEK